jgi:hypothetical protein
MSIPVAAISSVVASVLPCLFRGDLMVGGYSLRFWSLERFGQLDWVGKVDTESGVGE